MNKLCCTIERLILRPFTAEDGDGLYAYLSDPEVVRFEPYRPLTLDQAHQEAVRRAEDDCFTAVCLRDGTLIGNLYAADRGMDTFEIGYVFARTAWHHGYATGAARALLTHLFTAGAAHRVMAECDPHNPASWRLMERLGMRREAHRRQCVYFFRDDAGQPIWHDGLEYAILAEAGKASADCQPTP